MFAERPHLNGNCKAMYALSLKGFVLLRLLSLTYVSIKLRLIIIERNQLKLQDVSTGCTSYLRRISFSLSCPHLLVLDDLETASSSIDKSVHNNSRSHTLWAVVWKLHGIAADSGWVNEATISRQQSCLYENYSMSL